MADFTGWRELVRSAFAVRGAAPLAVRLVTGAVRFGDRSTAYAIVKADAADDPVPEATAAGLAAVWAPRLTDAKRSLALAPAARLFVEFLDAGGAVQAVDHASTIDVTAYRVQADGRIVQGPTWSDLRHRLEVRDEDVAGRPTLYRLSGAVLAGDAAKVTLHVAAEGLGYRSE